MGSLSGSVKREMNLRAALLYLLGWPFWWSAALTAGTFILYHPRFHRHPYAGKCIHWRKHCSHCNGYFAKCTHHHVTGACKWLFHGRSNRKYKVELKDFQHGVQIRAIGKPGSSGALLAELIIPLSSKYCNYLAKSYFRSLGSYCP